MSATKTERRCGASLALVACAVLGTLALSVPATAFLMHYFGQEGEQGNATEQVEAASLDGTAEAFRHGKSNSRERHQHGDVIKPVVHLMGLDPSNLNHRKTLVWKQVFSNHEAQDNSFSLVIPRAGFYYVYFQVGFRNSSCHSSGSSLTLYSELYTYHRSYKEDIRLLQAMETVCSHGNHATIWYTSINQGALVQLLKNHRLSVKVSHPDLVDYREGYTFFGAVVVP
ncbi:lymphotoxin-beta [Lissotriton helveticus]